MRGLLVHVVVFAFAASATLGCGLHRGTGGLTDGQMVMLRENPIFVPITDREFLWNEVVNTVDDYFKIQHEERVQLVDNILVEGRIDTFPTVGSTYLEPWRKDSTHGFEKLHASLQSVRRRAELRVIPTEGGYNIDVAVYKELEDVDRPERSTVGGATLRHDGSLIRQQDRVDDGPVTLGWIPQGRDITLEQRILSDLQSRLTNVEPPKAPHQFGQLGGHQLLPRWLPRH